MGRLEHCKQISLVCVGSACSDLATLGLSPLMVCVCFPIYTAQALGCSAGELSKVGPGLRALPMSKPLRFRFLGTPQRHSVGPVFCALPRSEQLRRPGAWRAVSPGGECILSPPRSSRSVSWVATGVPISSVPYVSSGELISGCDPPGRSQPYRIPSGFC